MTHLVLDFLSDRKRNFLCENVAHPIQFHRLTPIIESARHEHLVRSVRPLCKCEEPSSQRSNPTESVCATGVGIGGFKTRALSTFKWALASEIEIGIAGLTIEMCKCPLRRQTDSQHKSQDEKQSARIDTSDGEEGRKKNQNWSWLGRALPSSKSEWGVTQTKCQGQRADR